MAGNFSLCLHVELRVVSISMSPAHFLLPFPFRERRSARRRPPQVGRAHNVLNSSWNNPWKLTSIGLGLVAVTALATGLVVANWTGRAGDIAKDADKPGAVQPTTGRAGQP